MTFDRLKWTYRAWRYRQRPERQDIGYIDNFLFLPAVRRGPAA